MKTLQNLDIGRKKYSGDSTDEQYNIRPKKKKDYTSAGQTGEKKIFLVSSQENPNKKDLCQVTRKMDSIEDISLDKKKNRQPYKRALLNLT